MVESISSVRRTTRYACRRRSMVYHQCFFVCVLQVCHTVMPGSSLYHLVPIDL